MKKKIIYVITAIIVIFLLFGHPFIHLKNIYQNLTDTSSEHFAIADGYYREHKYDDIFYESKDFFSNKNNFDLESFNVSKFDEEGLIYVQAFLYDSLEEVTVYLNGNELHSQIETDYYSVFSDSYYIVKTIRNWIYKKDLNLNKLNKIDYAIGDKVYTYYFNVTY